MRKDESGKGLYLTAKEVTPAIARDMATVGIVPSRDGEDLEPVGTLFTMCGVTYKVTEYVTRQVFLDRVKEVGFNVGDFRACPAHMHFQRIVAQVN